MDRGTFAREMFDVFQQARDQIQVLKLEASTVGGHDAATALGILIDRAEKTVEVFIAGQV